MKNKCGECRYYFEQADFCRLNAWECIEEDEKCCEDFEPPTNGDKIRQMSDEELAMIFVCKMDSGVFYSHFTGGFYASQEKAIAATVAELQKEWKEDDSV